VFDNLSNHLAAKLLFFRNGLFRPSALGDAAKLKSATARRKKMARMPQRLPTRLLAGTKSCKTRRNLRAQHVLLDAAALRDVAE
jgi:hypothetical protein